MIFLNVLLSFPDVSKGVQEARLKLENRMWHQNSFFFLFLSPLGLLE